VSFGVFLCTRPLGFIGFPRSHRALAVSDGCRGLFSSDTVRRLVAQAVSSSRRLSASLKCFHLGSAPNIADTQVGSTLVHLPWGSRSLIATSVSRIVAARDLPVSRALRPWCSSHLRRFMPRPTLRVYFTPQPFLGFTLQGISLPHSRDASSTPLCPHAGSPELATRSFPRAPRSQSPPSRLYSMWKSVVRTLGVSLCSARSLPEFSLLQVSLSLLVPVARDLPFIALWPVCRSHPHHRRITF
jgi:hypothetical protein